MDNTNYSLIVKNAKDKVLNGLPIGALLLIFIFNVLFEIVNVNFDLSLILTATFWTKILIKYVVLVVVFSITFGWFKDLYYEKETSLAIRLNAQKTNEELTRKRLTKSFKEYTKEEMSKLERDYFCELLNDCGNIDTKYLGREYTLPRLKQYYKNNDINKYQYKLLKNIKTGKISFAKLTGDEIKYVGIYSVAKNKKFKNEQNKIVTNEFILKVCMMLAMAILIEFFLQSMQDESVIASLKAKPIETLTKVFTIIANYVTAIMFANKTGQKASSEYLRFTEVVTNFAKDFLEQQKEEEKGENSNGNRLGKQEVQ